MSDARFAFGHVEATWFRAPSRKANIMAHTAITHRPYGNAVTTPLTFEAALARTKAALKDEGFGVLSEIDVAKTLKDKIDVNFRPYTILGACNPQLAHRALRAEDDLGLLLPCNVVVAADERGTRVSTIDADLMMGMVGNNALIAIASEVNERLERVLARIADVDA